LSSHISPSSPRLVKLMQDDWVWDHIQVLVLYKCIPHLANRCPLHPTSSTPAIHLHRNTKFAGPNRCGMVVKGTSSAGWTDEHTVSHTKARVARLASGLRFFPSLTERSPMAAARPPRDHLLHPGRAFGDILSPRSQAGLEQRRRSDQQEAPAAAPETRGGGAGCGGDGGTGSGQAWEAWKRESEEGQGCGSGSGWSRWRRALERGRGRGRR
jgi:hypothetical protein